MTTAQNTGVALTEATAAKVKVLLGQEGVINLALRISMAPGGRTDLRYQLYFDDHNLDGDAVEVFDGVKLVVDRQPVPYLSGAVVDFADTTEQQGFTINNLNATSPYAHGDSFN